MDTQKKPAILVVDDELNIVEVMRSALLSEGYDVTATDKPTDVEGLLAARTFDLVLTDLKMEPIGGMDVLRRCKETDPNLQVLMITAFATV